MVETLRARDLAARAGVTLRTAQRWVARAVREGRATTAPAEIGSGAVRMVGAMVVVSPTTGTP